MASDTDSDSETVTKQLFTDNLDTIFEYLRSNEYPENFSRLDKKQLRRKAKKFIIKDSVLLYNVKENETLRKQHGARIFFTHGTGDKQASYLEIDADDEMEEFE